MFGQVRLAVHKMAQERRQLDGAEIVSVLRGAQLTPDRDPAAQLFLDLTFKRLLWGFVGFDLASRELPVAGQGSAVAALGAQDGAIAHDCRADDPDQTT